MCPLDLVAALPAEFIGRLRSKEVTEGTTATFRCELSKEVPVEWKKGPETLRAGDRVSLRQDGAVCELEIRELTAEDAGEYSCVCGQEKTSATLTVRGKDRMWPGGAGFGVQSLTSCRLPALIPPSLLVSASPSSRNSPELLPPPWAVVWTTRNQPPSCFPPFMSLQVLSCVLWELMSFSLSCHVLPSEFSQDSDIRVSLSSALPAEFTRRLRSKEATEGTTVMLHCELSKAAPVEWRKGPETLRAGDRVSLRQEGAVCELEIRDLVVEDAGEYLCVCGQERTSATLTIRGKDHVWQSRAEF